MLTVDMRNIQYPIVVLGKKHSVLLDLVEIHGTKYNIIHVYLAEPITPEDTYNILSQIDLAYEIANRSGLETVHNTILSGRAPIWLYARIITKILENLADSRGRIYTVDFGYIYIYDPKLKSAIGIVGTNNIQIPDEIAIKITQYDEIIRQKLQQ